MKRHLIPRFEWGRWCGSALTYHPNGGVELPPGLTRSMAQAFGNPTTNRERDELEGRVLCVQWLGLIVEIGVGRVR